MRFIPTNVEGAFIVEMEPHRDHRGFFARTFCAREFAAQGLDTQFVQCNISRSEKRGTLRGMHFQGGEAAETKLVRAVAGRILDVALDLRPESPTFGQYAMVELSEENGRALYVPRGCAHGFLTLDDGCAVSYQVSNYYTPEAERGVRWNDLRFAIAWPIVDPIVSEKDAAYPDYVVKS